MNPKYKRVLLKLSGEALGKEMAALLHHAGGTGDFQLRVGCGDGGGRHRCGGGDEKKGGKTADLRCPCGGG